VLRFRDFLVREDRANAFGVYSNVSPADVPSIVNSSTRKNLRYVVDLNTGEHHLADAYKLKHQDIAKSAGINASRMGCGHVTMHDGQYKIWPLDNVDDPVHGDFVERAREAGIRYGGGANEYVNRLFTDMRK